VEVVAIWLLEVIGSTEQSSLDSLEVEEGVIYIVSGNISQGSVNKEKVIFTVIGS
jgi:hypothetical protein